MTEKLPSFVRAVEVWIPDGDLLQLRSGAYGHLAQFEQASVELVLRKGQGLPGAAWESGRAEVWQQLGPPFVRTEPAREAGLEAAVALPIYRGHEMAAVVVFFCGARAQTGGCIEVWEPDDEGELAHIDGYYGGLRLFEEQSRHLKFKRGQGLPGAVMQRGSPCIVDDLRNSETFVRAHAARESGVESGLGIPLFCGSELAQVVLFLSAESTPLARAFEVWLPTSNGQLECSQAYYSAGLGNFGRGACEPVGSGQDLAGKVYESGLPMALDPSRSPSFLRRGEASAAGLDLGIGLPIHDGERVRAVVLLFV
ncbi:MAG: hypothetical protein QM778_24315 [Myxococcales bacterium]